MNYEVPWRPLNIVNKLTNTIYLTSQKPVSCSQQLAGRTPLRKFFLLKSHRAFSINPSLGRPAGGMINFFHSFWTWLYTFAVQTADSNMFCTAVAPLPSVVGLTLQGFRQWRATTHRLYKCLVWCQWFAGLHNKQRNKHIIIISWAVKAVTVGKAPPFPYSPLHRSGMYVYNGLPPLLQFSRLWTYQTSNSWD